VRPRVIGTSQPAHFCVLSRGDRFIVVAIAQNVKDISWLDTNWHIGTVDTRILSWGNFWEWALHFSFASTIHERHSRASIAAGFGVLPPLQEFVAINIYESQERISECSQKISLSKRKSSFSPRATNTAPSTPRMLRDKIQVKSRFYTHSQNPKEHIQPTIPSSYYIQEWTKFQFATIYFILDGEAICQSLIPSSFSSFSAFFVSFKQSGELE
jgi:hypothetical protein